MTAPRRRANTGPTWGLGREAMAAATGTTDRRLIERIGPHAGGAPEGM